MSVIQKLMEIKLLIKKTENDSNFKSEWEFDLGDIIKSLEKQPALAKSKNFKTAIERIKSLVISYKSWNPDYSPELASDVPRHSNKRIRIS